ncbi:Cullin binding-domain-containing protein [Flammula alnicola]|nr:Cullin binding-domain-containing protein [Flammula alnicola]
MPPKRKQVDDKAAEASTSTRSTRASTRSTTAKNTTTETASSNATSTRKTAGRASGKNAVAAATPSTNEGEAGNDSDAMESVHSAKRAKTSGSASGPRKTAKKASKQTAGRRGNQMEIDDEPIPSRKVSSVKASCFVEPSRTRPNRKQHSQELPLIMSNPKPAVHVEQPTPASAAKPAKKTTKHEPYTPQRALELFNIYVDADDADVIGPEGFEQLCNDATMPMDGSRPLIFAWQMGATEMAKVTKEEWVKATSSLKISSISQLALAITELEELLIEGKPAIKPGAKKDQEYDRALQSRNIDMETSVAFWTVLLVPKYSIMSEVLRFIGEMGTYKATNKDLWSMMLEFCETIKPTLQDYEADGSAWPTLLDDFVIWKKSHTANGNGTTGDMDVEH